MEAVIVMVGCAAKLQLLESRLCAEAQDLAIVLIVLAGDNDQGSTAAAKQTKALMIQVENHRFHKCMALLPTVQTIIKNADTLFMTWTT